MTYQSNPWITIGLVAVGVGLAFAVILPVLERIKTWRDARYATAYNKQKEAREADERCKVRDHQLNHGRQVFNWLKQEFAEYEKLGLLISKIEDNGGSFSIMMYRKASALHHSPILQLSYDFAGKHADDNYTGHIHYGAYGADILFLVLNGNPKWGLDHLVLKVVHEEFANRLAVSY
ncbi:MAG: hypothetical protein V4465_00475 [Patescibacteria group bacterium]